MRGDGAGWPLGGSEFCEKLTEGRENCGVPQVTVVT